MRQSESQFRSVAAAGLFVLLVAAGCGRNGGGVPADFSPGGQVDQETFLTTELINLASDSGVVTPGVRLRVYDRTPASGYEIYRRVPGQGFDRLDRVPARFDGSFDQEFEAYEAIDRDWIADRPVDYRARGEFAGIESPASPVTNVATLPPVPAAESLFAKPLTILCPLSSVAILAKTDSTPVLVWETIPGAVRYLLRVQRLDNRLFFYGFTPADGSSFYELGSGLGTVLHENTLTLRSFFEWTVEGLDAASRVIARSGVQRFETRPIIESDSLTFCTP